MRLALLAAAMLSLPPRVAGATAPDNREDARASAARFDRVEMAQNVWGGSGAESVPAGPSQSAAIPAPAGAAVLGAGLLALAAVVARRRRAAKALDQARGE